MFLATKLNSDSNKAQDWTRITTIDHYAQHDYECVHRSSEITDLLSSNHRIAARITELKRDLLLSSRDQGVTQP